MISLKTNSDLFDILRVRKKQARFVLNIDQPPNEKWFVELTSIRRSQVNDEIQSKFLTLYLLKTALKSVFPRELSIFLHYTESHIMLFRRRNDVKATSSSKFG